MIFAILGSKKGFDGAKREQNACYRKLPLITVRDVEGEGKKVLGLKKISDQETPFRKTETALKKWGKSA